MAAMFVNGSGQHEQSLERTFHRCFLPSFTSFGCGVSEPPQAILVSDWLISKKSSPLKPLGQMDRNLVGSIFGRSFIKTAHLVPIR
jgi:hypothetical protein